MGNKTYRLERIRAGTRYLKEQNKKARIEASLSKLKAKLESKEKVAKTKAEKERFKAEAEKYKAIERKKKAGGIIKKIASSVKFSQKLSSNLLNYGTNIGSYSSQRNPQQGPGRPRGSLKWISPFTGRPLPATEYYKEVRQFRRMQQQRAEQAQAQRLQQLAKQGYTPEQASMIKLRQQQMQQAHIIEQMRPQQNPQQNVKPIQVNNVPSAAVRPIWRRQVVVDVETDILGNKREILRGNDPRVFWN